jgi:prolyl-tRNA editing enzyme YbaK/EbsC (Cys-tRNA(Pro) deacylase)
MSDAIARVQGFFAARGLKIKIITFDSSVHTAQQAAAALGTSVRHIVKSLVFEADGQPVLVLCGGDRRVDTAKLAAVCAAQQVRKANATLTKNVTGYSIGGVPPVALATALPVFMDQGMLASDLVYAAAGTAYALFAIAPQVLKEMSGARVAALGEA